MWYEKKSSDENISPVLINLFYSDFPQVYNNTYMCLAIFQSILA